MKAKSLLFFRKSVFALAMLTFSISLSANSPYTWEWATNYGTVKYNNAIDVVTDAQGNNYFTGYYQGDVYFDNIKLTGAVNDDWKLNFNIFLVKTNKEGVVLWAKQLGDNTGIDQGMAVELAPDGSIYVAGVFNGSFTFAGSNFVSKGWQDFVLLKYAANGDELWARTLGSDDNEANIVMSLDKENNIIVAGNYGAPDAGFVPVLKSGNETLLTGVERNDIFIAKYDANGNRIWIKSAGGNTLEDIGGITVTSDNSIYGVCSSVGTIKFGSIEVKPIFEQATDVILFKMNTGGDFLWAKKYGEKGDEVPYDIIADKDDDLLITGCWGRGTHKWELGKDTLVNPGTNGDYGYNIFVAKMDSAGSPVWAHSAATPTAMNFGRAVVTDKNKNVYVAGNFESTTDFGGGYVFTEVKPNNSYNNAGGDGFVAKYDKNGNIKAVNTAGGNCTDILESLAVDDKGDIVTCGYFYINTSVGEIGLEATSEQEILFAKLKNNEVAETGFNVTNSNLLSLYPNPANDHFFVSGMEAASDAVVHIYNTNGMLVKKQLLKNNTISIAELPQGLYNVIIFNANETYHQKLMKY